MIKDSVNTSLVQQNHWRISTLIGDFNLIKNELLYPAFTLMFPLKCVRAGDWLDTNKLRRYIRTFACNNCDNAIEGIRFGRTADRNSIVSILETYCFNYTETFLSVMISSDIMNTLEELIFSKNIQELN